MNGKYKDMKRYFSDRLTPYGCIHGDNALNCYDKYYCMVAREKGRFCSYDSMMIIVMIVVNDDDIMIMMMYWC